RVAQQRRWADHEPVYEREHRRVGADAEGEREQHAQGECGAGPEAAERHLRVLPEALERRPEPHAAGFLPRPGGVPQPAARRGLRFRGRRPLGDQVLADLLSMEGQPLLELLAMSAETPPVREPPKESHAVPTLCPGPAGWRPRSARTPSALRRGAG